MKIFVVCEWYLPGYRAGGPIRSLANLVERVGGEFEFLILTRNRDFQDETPYVGLPLHCWLSVGEAKVFYVEKLTLSTIRNCIAETQPDLIYLNSLFGGSALKSLLLRHLKLLPSRAPVLIAPRGQLSSGALSINHLKKSFFLTVALRAGFYNGLSWHATSEPEASEILSKIGPACEVYTVPNLPSAQGAHERKLTKQPGDASFVFISRISPKKNLHFLLEAFSFLRGSRVSLDIYGPIDDVHYWEDVCLPLLPSDGHGVRIAYRGAIPNSEVPDLLARVHFFALPTLGENFGHAIVEALMAGCPPVISDRTPWRGLLSQRVGWDLPINTVTPWTEVMQQCVEMDHQEYMAMSNAARIFALNWLNVDEIKHNTANMFRRVLGIVCGNDGAIRCSSGEVDISK